MTPDHTAVPVRILGRVEPEFVRLPGKALARDATTKLRFNVHTAGVLHSMVPVFYTPWCRCSTLHGAGVLHSMVLH